MGVNPYVNFGPNPAWDRLVFYNKKYPLAPIILMLEVYDPPTDGHGEFWHRPRQPVDKPPNASRADRMMDEINVHVKCRAPDVPRKRTHHHPALERSIRLEAASSNGQQDNVVDDFRGCEYCTVSLGAKSTVCKLWTLGWQEPAGRLAPQFANGELVSCAACAAKHPTIAFRKVRW